MENKKIVNLIDSIGNAQNDKILSVLLNLHKIVAEEPATPEFLEYLLKRLLNGSTSPNSETQKRYLTALEMVLNIPELKSLLNTDDLALKIEDILHPKNSINKTERSSFQLAYVSGLGMLMMLRARVAGGVNASVAEVIEKIKQLVVEENTSMHYFVSGTISHLFGRLEKPVTKTDPQAQALLDLINHITDVKIDFGSYENANLVLSAALACQSFQGKKVKIEALKKLNAGAATIIHAKNLYNYYLQISGAQKVNGKREVPLYKTIAVYTSQNLDKFFPQIMKFFKLVLSSIDNSKENIQKRAMHLVLFFAEIISNCGVQFLEQFTQLPEAVKRMDSDASDDNNPNDILLKMFDFWAKHYNAKNSLSKQSAKQVEVSLTKAIQDGITPQTSLGLLSVLKGKPGVSLKEKKHGLNETLIATLYKDDKAWTGYFETLKNKVKDSELISKVNFFLGEIAAFARVSFTAKVIKNDPEFTKKVVRKRTNILGYLLSVYLSCSSEESLNEALNITIEWESEKLSIKKFRNKLFESILSIVFKRADADFLSKATSLFIQKVSESELCTPTLEKYHKKIEEGKNNIESEECLSALNALCFINVYESDADRNLEIIDDLVRGLSELPSSAPKKKVKKSSEDESPALILTDSLIALLSTTYPAIKPYLLLLFEFMMPLVNSEALHLISSAITRNDREYMNEEENEDEEEEMDAENDDEEEEDDE